MSDRRMFKKESARARNELTLDQLKLAREKAAVRLIMFKKAGLFGADDIDRVQDSVVDYDRRIARRERKIARIARNDMRKTASSLGIAL